MIRHPFNRDWYVLKEGVVPSPDPYGPVTVPHDAMLFERREPNSRNSHNTGYFPGGVYRYSKSFRAPEEWRGRSLTLEFEGVYMRSEVFVNGTLAGGRPSGYAIFQVPLDDLLEYGADNLVEVVAHNDKEPNSRWYSGSGIYRPVHLLIGDRLRVTPDGLRVSTKSIDGSTALVEVATEVLNDGVQERSFTLTISLTSPSGESVPPVDKRISIGSAQTMVVRQVVTIPGAEVWSPLTPRLYSAIVVLTEDDLAHDVVDETRIEFGIRTLVVDAARGLLINGESVKLRGACIHHDNGVIGCHTLDDAEDRRIRILKESGYNAIRSAHNPLSRAALHACDRRGLLVMDELTDEWWRSKSVFGYSLDFEDWWERDLESLIAKDANHPSVVMYSIGNEVAETATSRGIELNRRMADRTRQLDPTRLVTNCVNGFLNLISPKDDEKLARKSAANRESGGNPNKNLIFILNYVMGTLNKVLKYIVRLPAVDRRTRDTFATLDIAGYNYMVDRYRRDTKRYTDRVIVGSETTGPDTFRIWQEIETMPQVVGDFTWTGWDYIGEAGISAIRYKERPQLFSPWPALLAGTPVIDITGHRQTQSYLNEIVWHLRTGPYIAVQPVDHAGEKRSTNGFRKTDSIRSWSWEGYEGRTATVEVYADAHRVDLLLNGDLVGTELVGPDKEYLATFSTQYRPGELLAVAYDARGTEIGRDVLTSAGAEVRLGVCPEKDELRANGVDLLYVPIVLTDAAGIVKPLADRDVTVRVTGPGALLGLGSAQLVTEEGFSSDRHSTYQGRALAVIRAGHEQGDVGVTVAALDCEPVTIVIPVRIPETGTNPPLEN